MAEYMESQIVEIVSEDNSPTIITESYDRLLIIDGSDGSLVLRQDFAVPALVWEWQHNKGRYLTGISAYAANGAPLLAAPYQPTIDKLVLKFNTATAGFILAK